jgi:hypothetical protein
MRMLHLPLVAALAACGNAPGTATAQWVGIGAGSNVDEQVTGPARAGWCAESGTVLLEVQVEDRVAGALWRFDTLAPGSFPIALAVASDTVRPSAAIAARYLYLDEVRGYRGLSGTLQITVVDSTEISATAAALVQRVGETDTLRFTATFNQLPLVRDETLCMR